MELEVGVMEIKNIIVWGNYGWGGVREEMDGYGNGIIENWMKKIRDIEKENKEEMEKIEKKKERMERIWELRV